VITRGSPFPDGRESCPFTTKTPPQYRKDQWISSLVLFWGAARQQNSCIEIQALRPAPNRGAVRADETVAAANCALSTS
jgi:hypothetical protein